jgi:type VI protein secretion system component Hcp
MVLDIFLALSGVQGNSRDIDHPGWFEAFSFHSRMERTAAVSDRSSVCLEDFTLERHVDGASQTLKEAWQSGQQFDSATIDVVMRRFPGARLTYLLMTACCQPTKNRTKTRRSFL